MSTIEFGPYRATALWNEAVICFRDGMQLSEHRHRFHKHKNSFTGSEAVRFMHRCLQSNGLFNPQITREQTKQLLNQFFNADLIQRVNDCSSNSESRFRDSSKYLYEFTDKLKTFKANLPLTALNNRLRTLNKNTVNNENEDAGDGYSSKHDSEWKVQVLNKIKELLNPLDVSSLIPADKIETKWVVTNASPEWVKLKWNTELPHWILSAIHNLINCATKPVKQDTYPEFEIELFKIIADYFATLGSPLICPFLFDLITNIYLYFDSLSNLVVDKSALKMTLSQEDLLECISSPRKKSKPLRRIGMSNSCFETAFTSDDPVMRVVPQRSYDIVHLKRTMSFSSKPDITAPQKTKIVSTISGGQSKKKERKPLEVIRRTEKDNLMNSKNNSRSQYEGIDNVAFSFFSPNSAGEKLSSGEGCDLPSFPFQHFRSSPDCGRYMKSKSSDNLDNIHVYVNHGLNYSFDDSLNCDSTLDYKYAMESVGRLLKASQSKKSLSSNDTTGSYYTASNSSNHDLSEAHSYENVNLEEPSEKETNRAWHRPIARMCISVFQMVLLLIPPNNRAQLKLVLRILHHVPQSSKFHQLSFAEMLSNLQDVILKPPASSQYACDQNIVYAIIQFLADNHEEIFSELPPHVVREIENEMSSAKSKENVYCEQVSGHKFEEQKVVSSRSALDELLCQILANKTLSQKERKKHLKMFKEYYPEIYYTRIGAPEKIPKKSSSKNFRL